ERALWVWRETRRSEETMSTRRVRIGAVSDFHCSKSSRGAFRPLIEQAAGLVDVLLLCGGLPDHSDQEDDDVLLWCGDMPAHDEPEEAELLARELAGIKVPMLGVLGNHDHHSDAVAEV